MTVYHVKRSQLESHYNFFASGGGGGLAEQIAVKLVHGSRTVSGVIGIWGSRSRPILVRYDAR